MIGCSTNRDGDGVKFPENSAEIGVNVETYFIGKKRRATRRGKDNMDEKAGVGMRHSYAPPGLRFRIQPYTPGLRRGATVFCPLRGLGCE